MIRSSTRPSTGEFGATASSADNDITDDPAEAGARWQIFMSTYPWLEGTQLALAADISVLEAPKVASAPSPPPSPTAAKREVGDHLLELPGPWVIVENSFTRTELVAMFS